MTGLVLPGAVSRGPEPTHRHASSSCIPTANRGSTGCCWRRSTKSSSRAPDYDALLAQASPRVDLPAVPEWATFGIPYTSGTTGKPKGVMLSHRSRSLGFLGYAVEYGIYSPQWGEQLGAYVVPADDSFDAAALLAFARLQLAPFKIPKRIVARRSCRATPTARC